MKKLIKEFKEFLKEDQLSDYDQNGEIVLYHYSRVKEPELVLDPEHGKSSYSRREYETASTPRVFFYADPKHKERFFAAASLYRVNVPINQVYDLRNDPDGYVGKIKHPIYGLRKGIEWDELLEAIREDYDGAYYSAPHMDIVVWFRPIRATLVPPEEQIQLEAQ